MLFFGQLSSIKGGWRYPPNVLGFFDNKKCPTVLQSFPKKKRFKGGDGKYSLISKTHPLANPLLSLSLSSYRRLFTRLLNRQTVMWNPCNCQWAERSRRRERDGSTILQQPAVWTLFASQNWASMKLHGPSSSTVMLHLQYYWLTDMCLHSVLYGIQKNWPVCTRRGKEQVILRAHYLVLL